MAISKKRRFEVFKRDNFTCQYCGRKTPEVILEIDHIIPKKKKGKDDIQNLITSCFECNRGKGGTPLEKVFIRKDLKEDLYILAERELQLKEYNRLLSKKRRRETSDLRKIDEKIQELTEGKVTGLNQYGQRSMKYFLSIFPIERIIEAWEIAYSRLERKKGKVYFEDLFRYTCGIMHNWRKDKNAKQDN